MGFKPPSMTPPKPMPPPPPKEFQGEAFDGMPPIAFAVFALLMIAIFTALLLSR